MRTHRTLLASALLGLAGLSFTPLPPAAASPARFGAHGDDRASATRVVWTQYLEGQATAHIVSADPNGKRVRVLTNPADGVADIHPHISPDGKMVTFERDYPDGRVDVMLVGSQGAGEHAVPLGCTDPCAQDLTPSWAPDGRHLVFTRVIGPFTPLAASAALYSAALDGSHLARISRTGIDGQYEDYVATFAPRGYMVFLRVASDETAAVFRLDHDGSEHQLTPWDLHADLPSVSPARSGPTRDLVVFETPRDVGSVGSVGSVTTVPATCPTVDICVGMIVHVTSPTGGTVSSFNPAWSPDGRRIAFTRFDRPVSGPVHADIWTMRSNGTDPSPVSLSPMLELDPAWGVAARS
ncbi:TolB family protein [Cellulomonas sp. McL0617]|uniref:TolB family protein n=1 Tax=Cellulomonas sp. McL0617 TaxID=3415675 RepID=UPI003CF1D720